MCLICDKLQNNQMTLNEARKNMMELRILNHIKDDHYYEIVQIISEFQKKEDDKKAIYLLKNKE